MVPAPLAGTEGIGEASDDGGDSGDSALGGPKPLGVDASADASGDSPGAPVTAGLHAATTTPRARRSADRTGCMVGRRMGQPYGYRLRRYSGRSHLTTMPP